MVGRLDHHRKDYLIMYKYFYFNVGEGRKYSLRMNVCNYKDGRLNFEYVLRNPDKKILFHGKDFSAPNGHTWKENAMSLMGFLTLRKGDTDDEYFNNYTDDQLAFSESNDNDELQMMVYDYDTRNEK